MNDEKKFIEDFLKNQPDFSGWVKNEDTDYWYYIKLDKKSRLPSKEILEIDGTLYAFNEYGRAIDSFVSFSSYKDEKGSLVYLFNSYVIDLSKQSLSDCLDFDDTYHYFNGHKGLAKNVVIKIKLSDDVDYDFVTDIHGKYYPELILGNKLCVKGFIANSQMFQSPYKTFGTIIINNIPFLVSDSGTILNTKKSVYQEGKIFAYVNTDKTFFYSVYPNDPKWY